MILKRELTKEKRLLNVQSDLCIPEEVEVVEQVDGGYSVKTVAERRQSRCLIRDIHITPTEQRNPQVGFEYSFYS